MEKSTFELYCNGISRMRASCADWQKNARSLIADYLRESTAYGFGAVLANLIVPAYEIVSGELARGAAFDAVDMDELADRLSSESYVADYRFPAYLFAVCVAAVALCGMPTDRVDTDGFDENELMSFDGNVTVMSVTDPYMKQLVRYGIRLLDFSRTNQLVHFRPSKSTAMGLLCDDVRESLRKLLSPAGKIYLAGWKNLHPKAIYKCKICGRVEGFDYELGAKKVQPARACPVCDANNRHNRKSMSPVKEKPGCLPDDKYVCACGEITPVRQIEAAGYVCPACGKAVETEYSPIITHESLRAYGSDEMICTLNDASATEALRLLMNKAKNMERNFGLHVLYLACGFLQWKDANGTEYNSPILLCPVNLSVDRSRGRYCFEADASSGGAFEVNKTLVQMLSAYSRTCSIKLPEPDSANVYSYFSALRRCFAKAEGEIRDIVAGWKIECQCGLGLFHYQKLQLHQDLTDNFDKYLDHPIIRRLCGDLSAATEQPEEIERPSMKYMILDADSSQENVIKRAQEGQSFILQGPPGSGKSQTITNIITTALGAGKTVLFVTEKASARAVIADNLIRSQSADKKLTDFVLDFDAFKKRGGAVGRDPFVTELNRCLTPYIPTGGYDDRLLADEELVHGQISSFIREAREEYGGRSYLRLLNDMAPFASYDELKLSGGAIPADMVRFMELLDAVQRYYECAVDCPGGTDYRSSPLYGCKGDSGNSCYRAALAYSEACKRTAACTAELSALGLKVAPEEHALENCAALLRVWKNMPALTEEILSDLGVSQLEVRIKRAKERKAECRRIEAHGGRRYMGVLNRDRALALDYFTASEDRRRYAPFIRRVGRRYSQWKQSVYSCLEALPAKLNYAGAAETLTAISVYREYLSMLEKEDERRADDIEIYGFAPSSPAEWDALIAALECAKSVCAANNSAILDLDRNTAWALSFAGNRRDAFVAKLDALAAEADGAADEERRAAAALSAYFYDGTGQSGYPRYEASAKAIIDNSRYLAAWHKLNLSLGELKANGWLAVLDELIADGERDIEQISGRLFRTYYADRISALIDDNNLDALRDFTRHSHESLLKKYGDIDGQALSTGAKRTFETLKSLLRQEAAKGGGSGGFTKLQSKPHYSIKRTIAENWDYIKRIKPCFMMSPLNVSQYIDMSVQFDLVIFDEASQIFTEDALASIVRGKQVIIAGDSKQLPPCDFFRAGDVSSDEEESYYEAETNDELSLLMSADKALNDASVSLAWHYRSCDESLIHFANTAMDYDLITFPSAKKDLNNGVFAVNVPYAPDKCYVAGKGGSHINAGEVERIVNLIYEEMTHPVRGAFSIGVVAFSNAQATEIEARWEEFRADPTRKAEIERWERAHADEPLIFCNLDTVQGDERDTTIISVCYSRDANGKFILPYLGRIRLESGKKRINVAVTRARHRMIVVSMLEESTLKNAIEASSAPEENKAGAKMLLDFLGYARLGGAYDESEYGTTQNAVAASVCRLLDDYGIKYDEEVGMSACKINIGIRGKGERDFCLGIIIDDPARVDFDSVREYSRLTEQVLTGKYGWKLYRIYPAAWINDYEHERALLLSAIAQASA